MPESSGINKTLVVKAFDFYPEPIIFGNLERKIVLANTAASELFGYRDPGAMVDLPVYALVPPDLIPEDAHDRMYDAFVEGRRTREIGREAPLFGLTKQGKKIPIWLKLFTVNVDGQVYIGEVVRDRADHLRQQEEIEKQEIEKRDLFLKLEQSNKELKASNKDMQVQLRQSELQELVVKWLIYTGAFFYSMPFMLSVFRRVPNELMSLGRDATILVIGALVTATGAAAGVVKKAKRLTDENEEDQAQ